MQNRQIAHVWLGITLEQPHMYDRLAEHSHTTLPKLLRRSRPWRCPRASAAAQRRSGTSHGVQQEAFLCRTGGWMEVDQTTMVPAGHGGESMAQTTGTARRGAGRNRIRARSARAARR